MLNLPTQMDTMVLHSLLPSTISFGTRHLETDVTDAGVNHFLNYPSDHSPVYCKFKIPLIYNRAMPTSNARTNAIP